ncbi:uncharacterized protein LOC5502177 isoform X2 [Nematostella vectensis]|uniref:uncharacterized protein LOC5502177 isoform X2 n=1 Tax=Nematostella vectensis TaxID=45351 RepID=UPI0020775F5E|nr:uncharacterized protein LOC5502177 isoform X2 [Nematostella vectensis]
MAELGRMSWFMEIISVITCLAGFQATAEPQGNPVKTQLSTHTSAHSWQVKDDIFNSDDVSMKTLLSAIHKLPSPQLRHFLYKAQQGQPLNVLVIGGSNTAGGGLYNFKEAYYKAFVHWWNQVLKPELGSELSFSKVAIGGTGSDFFTFCLQNFLPEQVDLVLIELSVNDYGSAHGSAAEPLELLTRRVLRLHSMPLVLYVNLVDRSIWDGDVMNTRCLNMENLGQRELSQHYGITQLSWREVACPLVEVGGKRRRVLRESKLFHRDKSHVSNTAHAHIAVMIAEYFKEALKTEQAEPLQSPATLPQSLYSDPLVLDLELESSLCLTYLSPDWREGYAQSLEANITVSEKFHFVTPAANRKSSKHLAFRTDAYGGWKTNSNNGKLRIRFTVPTLPPLPPGSAALGARSVSIIYRSKDNDATALAWVDDRQKDAVHMRTNFCGRHMYQTRVLPLFSDVLPGIHTVTVKPYGKGGEFMVSGLIVGYQDYSGFLGYRPFDVRNKVWSKSDYGEAQCEERDEYSE